MFFHIVDMSIVNAFILSKIVCSQPKTNHFQLRENLVRALCGVTELATPKSGSGGRPAKDTTLKHYLIQGTKELDNCVYCKNVHEKRSQCSKICAGCGVPLCSRD